VGIALGYLNMPPGEFWHMRLKDFFLKLKFWQHWQEEQTKQTAELVRLQTYQLINIQLTEKDKLKKPSELWRYEWDEEAKQATVDPEMTQRMLKSLLNG
jgi:hypothetical protein